MTFTQVAKWRAAALADVTPDIRRPLWPPQEGREATIPGPPMGAYVFEGWRLATGPDGAEGGYFVAVLYPTRRMTHVRADGSEVTTGGALRLRLLARWDERGEVYAHLARAERNRERLAREQRAKWSVYLDRLEAQHAREAPPVDDSGAMMSGVMLLGQLAQGLR